MNERYLTTAEVAELSRTSPETVRWWRHTGYGPNGFKLGRRVLYPETEVEAWLRQHRHGSAPRVPHPRRSS